MKNLLPAHTAPIHPATATRRPLTASLLRCAAAVIALVAAALTATAQIKIQAPDYAAIQAETNDPSSRYHYPKLLKMFMSNDTVMTDDDYRYFYYGTMFQEDYDPYRADPFEAEQKELEPLYFKQEHLTRAERTAIENLARKSLENNPLNLRQLMYRVYVYEQNKKYNLAKIWKHKLDHLLLTIASSGTGDSPAEAWAVVYPRHEFDFFNLSGGSVLDQQFQPPYYERLTVRNKKGDKTTEHYFDLHHMLEQYYLKHPDEAADNVIDDEQTQPADTTEQPAETDDAQQPATPAVPDNQ